MPPDFISIEPFQHGFTAGEALGDIGGESAHGIRKGLSIG
jgi:hypothetical protein